VSTVSIRELANNTKNVVEEVARSGRPAVVTQRGRPMVAVVPIDEEALEDWILANAPEYVRSMEQADAEIADGIHGTPLDEVLAELDDDQSTGSL
jgi:prevent-host-death family protein